MCKFEKRVLFKAVSCVLICLTVGLPLFSAHLTADSYAISVDTSREKEIRERTGKILAAGEFSEKRKDDSVLRKIALGVKQVVEYIKEKAKRLFLKVKGIADLISFDNGTNRGAAVLFIKILGIAILAAFLMLIVHFVLRASHMSKSYKKREDAEFLGLLKDAGLVEQKALEFALRGDCRQGIRYLYIAMLLRFNEANLIKIDKAKTNRQYMDELSRSGFGMIEPAVEFTHAFNMYWYGNRKAEREAFDYWYGCYGLLKREAGE